MEKSQKQKISKVTDGLNKTFGKGTVYVFGDAKEEALVVDVFSTGSISVDEILGNYDKRGIPRGRITEMWGPPGGGKTSLCMQTIAEVQKAGETAAFVDVEYSFDPAYARALGVRVEDLVFSQPDYGEEALQIAESLIKDGGVGIVVVDSVANLVPKTEYDGEIGDQGVGLLARMMTQATRKLSNALLHSDTALVFINQIRDVIGSQFPMVKPPGGNGLEHLASLRLEVKRIGSLKDGDKVIGARTKVKTLKNKSAAPYQECEVDVIFGHGISHEAEAIEYGVKLGIVEKEGISYLYEKEKLGVGKENTRTFLVQHPELSDAIRAKIREKLFLKKEKK